MNTVGTFEEARDLSTGSVGLVPTMGFLHEGHLSLIEAAREHSDTVIVSLFVNPLQFNESSDLAAYPRSIERDTALAGSAGAHVLFNPDIDTMYPNSVRTSVSVAGVSDGMEGEHRPGHFAGVALVVAKLFGGLQPTTAYFGRKDAQQLAVISTLTSDLSLPVDVLGLPIVREMDGLALSSRNVRIPTDERAQALGLSRALFAAADRFEEGERSSAVLVGAVNDNLDPSLVAGLDYVEVADGAGADRVAEVNATSFIALAATVGGVRLIDNVFLDPKTGRADRGVRLRKPSILYGDG